MRRLISIEEITKKIFSYKSVALFCHIRPDGDTVGSAVALKLALKKSGIDAEVFCTDEMPKTFKFLKATSEVKNKLIKDYEIYVAIDNADMQRLGEFGLLFEKKKETYSIDHHISNTNFAKYNYVCDRAANCENVYNVIRCANVEIDSEMANLLALGITTDTGNFRHKNVTAETLKIMSELIGYGADLNAICYHCFTEQSKERAKLFGLVMSRIRYFKNDKIAVATVRQSDFKETNAEKSETEGFIDFVMGIEGVEIGICIMEIEKNKYKISLRSKKADVNKVASTFGGGGHVLASGCQLFGEYEEVVERITYTASLYIDE